MEEIMKMLARIKLGLLAGAVAVAMALPASADGKEGKKKEDIKLDDCPVAVQKTIRDNAAGGEIIEVEKEIKKDGTVVYEAEVKTPNGKKVDIQVAEDGKLIKVEADEDDDNDEDDEDDGDDEDDNDDNEQDD
jgi:uncharacterized membrane protein YkoI